HEIDEGDDTSGGRYDQTRKIDFVDQVRVADKARRCFADDAREQKPGEHAGEHEYGVRHISVARQFGDLAEYDSEDDHRQKRTHDCPGYADDRLLVAHGDVSPSEDRE